MTELDVRADSTPTALAAVRGPRLARRRRYVAVVTGLLALVLLAGLATLSLGDLQVSIPDVFRVLFGQGDSLTNYLVENRLPRVVAALVAGSALALSGALFQSLLRNALASPDILGITGGASVATVIGSIVLGWSSVAESGLAFAGALAVALVIYLLAWKNGVTGQRFVLVGIGVAFMVTAVLGYTLTRADISQAQVALSALVGGVGNADWSVDSAGAIGIGVLVCVLVPAARSLRVLQLDEDTASGLGVPTATRRAVLLVLAVLFAAVGVATAGPLAFVAFMSAPIARRLLRDGSPGLLPSALVGSLVVLGADLAGQHLLGSTELPAGVLTGAIGAPYLLWLLATGERTSGGSA